MQPVRISGRCLSLLLLLVWMLPTVTRAGVLELPLGDPSRRQRQILVTPGTLHDTRAGDTLQPAGIAARLQSVRLLFVGEDHTSADSHRAQLDVIRALDAAGRDVVLALEMYSWHQQTALDRWTAGDYDSDEAFLEDSGWYESWGYRWEYYRDIFHFARARRLPLVGVNAPRELVKQIRTEGMAALESARAADAGHLPPAVRTDDPDYRRLFKAYMGVSGSSHADAALEGLYRAQCAWDAIMGWNALRALESRATPDTIVVVLLGTGHVAYGLGAPRQVADRLPAGAIATYIPVAVTETGSVRVQASHADLILGLPPPGPPAYPELGLSLAGPPAPATNRIIHVVPGSPAARAGLIVGEQLEGIGDRRVKGSADVRRGLAGTQWGDRVQLRVRGPGGITRDITVRLDRPGNAP